jgi:hypothetical protein
LVFIGQNINFNQLEDDLNACLLTDDELAQGPTVWKEWAEPFDLAGTLQVA